MAITSTSSSAAFSRAAIAGVVGVLAVWTAVLPQSASPRFYPDDPLWTDNDRVADASKVVEVEDSNSYDFVVNTLGHPGELRDVRALNVNTVDEVPDSSWFTNRIGRNAMSTESIKRGPDRAESINVTGWKVSGGKSAGVQPGFRMTDAEGQIYQIEVDPPSNPEIASGAEIIGTAFYHAIGYNVVDVYPAEIDRDALVIADGATIRDPLNGRRRQMKKYDLDNVFNRAARLKNGHYRVLVSRFASGTPLGNFRYYGRAPGRSQRSGSARAPPRIARCARLRRVAESRRLTRHQQSRHARADERPRMGQALHVRLRIDSGERHGLRATSSAGQRIHVRTEAWMAHDGHARFVCPAVDHHRLPGRAEVCGASRSRRFDPVQWKPEYPNPAFANMRPDDAFWAARIVSKFSDAAIRAVVEKAEYTEPAATDFMTKTIIARRDKVVATWLNQVCPVVDTTMAADGTLVFTNAAVDAKAATAPERYELNWFRFDNATDQRTPVGEAMRVTAGSARLPNGVTGDFVGLSITAVHAQQPGWANPSTFFFRRASGGWSLVGVERGAATSAPTSAQR